MLTIYLARHGETEENLAKILQGHLPGHLTANGIQQAEALRNQLSNEHFDAFLCSDLQRCKDTAAVVNSCFDMDIEYTSMLRERDWGSVTGVLAADMRGKEFPADVETVEQMFCRAEKFLNYAKSRFDGKKILVLAHGLFNRVIMAYLDKTTISEIKPMQNAEVRVLQF